VFVTPGYAITVPQALDGGAILRSPCLQGPCLLLHSSKSATWNPVNEESNLSAIPSGRLIRVFNAHTDNPHTRRRQPARESRAFKHRLELLLHSPHTSLKRRVTSGAQLLSYNEYSDPMCIHTPVQFPRGGLGGGYPHFTCCATLITAAMCMINRTDT
jgi:hypothetical protein